MMNSEAIKRDYLIHWLVWHNDCRGLRKHLQENQEDIEKIDPRGRTPLHLSVSLGHLESVRLLLEFKANVHVENAKGWSVLHEAISTGDPELVSMLLQQRDYQRAKERIAGIETLLSKLNQAPDFYVEMKWEFTSWIPLLSKVCPSDVYKVWKSGSYLRVDTTLLGFDQMSWQRGKRSFIFKGDRDAAKVIEIDHDSKEAFVEQLSMQTPHPNMFTPLKEHIEHRLTHPLVCTHLNTDNITFERGKSGFWGWRSDRTDNIGEYEAEVYVAQNLEFITKTRTEHVDDKESKTANGSTNVAANALNSILGLAKSHSETSLKTANGNDAAGACMSEETKVLLDAQNPSGITLESYFSCEFNSDIGRPMELTTKIQKFKATVWQSTDYPLSLQEQVTPIIDLMAISNTHFAKLKDFIALKLPKGFPIKIEIPLFHVLNARITFGNLNGCSNIPESSYFTNDPSTGLIKVDEECFEIPEGYKVYGTARDGNVAEDEDERLLQFAIQQSLLDANSADEQVTLLEALQTAGPLEPAPVRNQANGSVAPMYNSQLEMALSMSKKAQLEEAKQRQLEEEELQKVLALSLEEK